MSLTDDQLREFLAEEVVRTPSNPWREQQIKQRAGSLWRRGRRRMAVSALATAAATAAVVVGAYDIDPPDRGPVAVERVSPEAVHVLPPRLPNGDAYQPELFADARTLIVLSQQGGGDFDIGPRAPGRPTVAWRYDVTTRKATKIARLDSAGDASRPSTRGGAAFAVAGGRLIWPGAVTTTGSQIAVSIWAVPLSGGKVERLAQLSTQSPDGIVDLYVGLDVVANMVIVSLPSGVYQVPATGGDARLIPRTQGKYVMQSWPWAFTVSSNLDLYNVVTGQSRTPNLDAKRNWMCSLTWCVVNNGGEGASWRPTVAQRRDGTGTQIVPRAAQGTPLFDRYVRLLNGNTGGAYYDLKTKRMIDLGDVTRSNADESMQYRLGDKFCRVINMRAIR